MKTFSAILLLALATPALAQTQLSSSPTFQNALNGKASTNNPAFTGTASFSEVRASGNVSAGRASGVGYVSLASGSTTSPGQVQFFTADNIRRLYIGYSYQNQGSDVQLQTENGYGLNIQGRVGFGCLSNSTYGTYFCTSAYFGNSASFNGGLYTNSQRIDHLRGASVAGGAFTMPANSSLVINVPLNGAVAGDFVSCSLSVVQPYGLIISSGGVVSNNNVSCVLQNPTSSGISLPSYVVYGDVMKRQ